MKNKKTFILPVILLVLVFVVSCATKETLVLENITISTDSHPEFVLKNTDNLSEEQLKKDEKIASALNKALTDYPELSTMLEADMIDGGSNSYIYEGSEPFFKTLNEFTNENYKKAKSMFPDITCEEFYYSVAIGYGIAKSTMIEETTIENIFEYETSDGSKSPETLTIKPSFDDVMVHAFWASYFGERFETNLSFDQTDPTVYDEIIKNNPDPDVYGQLILDTPANLEMMIKSQIMFIPIAHEYEKWCAEKKLETRTRNIVSVGIRYGGNDVLTRPLRETLNSFGLSDKPHDLSSEFMEVGTAAMTYSLLTRDNSSKSGGGIQVGDIGWATVRYADYYGASGFRTGYKLITANALVQFASLCKINLGGNIVQWAYTNEITGSGRLAK